MIVLITGSKGQLGLELINQLSINKDITIIKTDKETLDISDYNQVESVLNKQKPDIVINCAAYTQVDNCEDDIETAYKVNALGPKHLSIVCESINSKLVHISTDYVFKGDENIGRQEDDLTNPINTYGKSKLLGEEFVKKFCKKHFIIRTAWLYGDGKNFVDTMIKLASKNDVINVVGDQYGSPTSTKELSKVIINLMTTQYYGTFHATCEGECSWYDFAKEIFKIKNINVKVNKVTSDEFIQKAKRPKYSVLDNFMLRLYNLNTFSRWDKALRDYLE